MFQCRYEKIMGRVSGARTYYKQRNEEIREKYREGFTVEELALNYGLSVEAIHKIV